MKKIVLINKLLTLIILTPYTFAMDDKVNEYFNASRIPHECKTKKILSSNNQICNLMWIERVDADLNGVYQKLLRNLSTQTKQALQKEQVKWLDSRDKHCELNYRSKDKVMWFIYVINSTERVECVFDLTEKRIQTLDIKLQNTYRNPESTGKLPVGKERLHMRNVSNTPEDYYFIRSVNSHRSGRYYFEVIVEHGSLSTEPIQEIVLAKITDGNTVPAETSFSLRSKDLLIETPEGGSINIVGGNFGQIKLPRIVIGVAADLDNGKVYFQKNGQWISGTPGSMGGTNIPTGKLYLAEIETSTEIDSLVDTNVLDVNFGETQFELNPPEGYRGFDSLASNEFPLHIGKQIRVFGPNSKVHGKNQLYWVKEYWKWVRSFEGTSPSADLTGELCASKQNAPVWFLTGTTSKETITRKCHIPKNKIILIPLINALAQSNPGENTSCNELIQTLGRATENISDLKLEINRISVPAPDRYFINTGCFDLSDASRNISGDAAGTGYFLFIEFNLEGEYNLHVQGTNNVLGFSQDVKYSLNITQ